MKRSVAVGCVVTLVLVVLGAGGLLVLRRMSGGPPGGAMGMGGFEPMDAVQIVSARETQWQETADLVGTVFALRSVVVRTELSGVVRFVGFQSGDVIEKDQVLLKQDDAAERADLDAARASVRVAEANIAQAEAQVALAQAELDRIAGAGPRAVAEVEVDRARTRLESMRADRVRWMAEADSARARVAQVETRLAKLTIRAPFRARAGMRTVHEGQYLAEGADVVALQELSETIYLDFAVPQEYAPRVRPGLTVMAEAPLLGAEPVPITIASIDAVVNTQTRNIRLRAVVNNPDGVLVPGMSVQVRVPIDTPRTLVVVPSTAVRRSAYGNSVFVIAQGENAETFRAKQRFVKLGASVGEDVIVLEGLELGERIAAAGSFKLRDGSKVMVGPPPGAPGAPTGGNAAHTQDKTGGA